MSRIYELGGEGYGACHGAAGTSSSGIWVLEREDAPRYTAKTFVWIFGSHQGCQRDSSHLSTCSPFTCDAGNMLEGKGETEAEAVAALREAQRKLADSLF